MTPSLPRAALSIDALVDHVPQPPRTRQCGKCQEAHSRCDGRDPCHSCELRGTLCGYAWSSFSAPPPAPVPHPPPPARPQPGYAQHVLYFPPPAKRPARPPDPPLARPPPADGGWAIVPAGTNAPAVTRGGEPGPPIKPCKTCQARNTTCDGVVPVCGSCRTRRLECYIAAPAAATTAIPERQRVQSTRPASSHNKVPALPRGLAPSEAQTQTAPPHPARTRALSSNEDGKPSRASLSFMLNPTPASEQPVASSSRAPPPRPPELVRSPPVPAALVTPPTPIAPNGLEQAQSRMDVDARPPNRPVSPMLEPRSGSPLSPSSSTAAGGASLSRRPSRKRSASPSSLHERWNSSSPSRESVSSESYARPLSDSRSIRTSFDSHSARPSIDSLSGRPLDSHSNRLSIDSQTSRPSIDSYHPHPSADEVRERPRSKSSLSHLLDGDGQGGIARQPAPTPPRPISNSGSRPTSKRGSISTAMADMRLKSAATSRASSPGSTTSRERAHAWPTFSTVGEAMGPDVWRNETEADMRRREIEAEERKKARQARGTDVEMTDPVSHGEVDLHRRRSEGPKRRRIGSEEEMADHGVSILEQIRRASGEGSRRTSLDDVIPIRRTSADDVPSRRTLADHDAHAKPKRHSTDDAQTKRVPGAWQESVIVVSDSPKVQSNVWMVLEADESKEVLIASPVEEAAPATNGVSVPAPNVSGDGLRKDSGDVQRQGSSDASNRAVPTPSSNGVVPSTASSKAPESDKTSGEAPSKNVPGDVPVRNGILDDLRRNSAGEIKRSPSIDSRNGSTPPMSKPFPHIWPPPSIPTLETKKGRKKAEPEPAPSRSFITQRNLPSACAPAPVEDDARDKEPGAKDAGSSLRSLANMTTRGAFMSSMQDFLSQPKHKGRAVIMTKALMKDALSVLLDPATDELLKDYIQPERPGPRSKLERSGSQSKLERSGSQPLLERTGSQANGSQTRDDEKSSRDGTPAQGRKPSDTPDHTTLEFRAWAKRMFSTVKTARGEDVLAFGGKPVTIEDDIYETIVLCHSKGNHCSAEETVRLVEQAHSWVPRVLVEAFVQKCPGCPASNKVASATARPKKRKWVRKDEKQPAVAAPVKRKPVTGRKGKAGRKKKAADESEEEQEHDAEEQEHEMEEDELGEEIEAEPEVEEDEMESEDETIARPASVKMDVDDA